MGDIGFSDYKSVYTKDYYKKQVPRPKKCTFKDDYPDILSGPYTEYIVPTSRITDDQYGTHETQKQYLPKVEENYPKIHGRYLNKEVDEDKIILDYKNLGRSVYQVELCRLEDGFVSKKTLSRVRATLPPDWEDAPLTIQRASYRNYKELFNWRVIPKPCEPPVTTLKPNYKERAILKVTTGDSEYGGVIGKLGSEVIRDHLHGVIQDPDTCRIWQRIELNRAGQRYRVTPPYSVLYLT